MSTLTLRDATHDASREVMFADWVDGFSALRFQTVGRVLPHDMPSEDYFSMFGPEHEGTARRSMRIPVPIQVSPQRDAFVEVSEWFGNTPSIRIRSVLTDGSLVETQRRWEQPPAPVANNPRHAIQIGIEEEMVRSHAPNRGRSTIIADGDTAGEIWDVHAAHVLRRAQETHTSPIAHATLDTFMQLTAAAHNHDWQCKAVSGRSMKLFLVPMAVTPFIVGQALFYSGNIDIIQSVPPVVAPLIGALAPAFFFLKVFPRLPYKMVSQRLRPKFKFQPVPSGS